jgi:HPr kinase/phosphorylase
MTQVQTLQDLMERIGPRLKLRWLTTRPESARALRGAAAGIAGQSLVGSLKCIHPNRLQVIGHPELLYLSDLGKTAYRETVGTFE